MTDKRLLVVRELVSTERSYLGVLECLIDCFLKPLSNVLPPGECHVLFPQIETLANYSRSLLEALEAKVNVWHADRSTVGDVFVKMGPFLKATATFVNGHPDACAMAERLATTPAFRACTATAMKDPRAKNNPLLALLIAPIQRIPRYVLLLNELLKCTPEQHADRQKLVDALALLRQVADDVNEAKGRADNSRVLLATALRIKPTVGDLLEPHRRLLLDGVLLDVAANRQFRFLLLSDVLLKLSTDAFAYGPHKGKFDLKAVLSLGAPTRIATNRVGADTFGIDFDNGVSLTLRCDTRDKKDEWLTALHEAIAQFPLRPLAYRGRALVEPFEEQQISVLATPALPPKVHIHARIYSLLAANWQRTLSVLIGIAAAFAAYAIMHSSSAQVVAPTESTSWYVRLLVPGTSSSTALSPLSIFPLALVLFSLLFLVGQT
jgi:hypothetical protein